MLISDAIGSGWIRDLDELRRLAPMADDKAFRTEWSAIRRVNKAVLADRVMKMHGIDLDPDTLFDCQVKRLHEYKRQILNALHAIALHERLRTNPSDFVPRSVIFAGKAAPGYAMAKLVIKLIHAVGDVVNNDPSINGLLKVVFIPDYNVSNAEKIIPACDLSEQISTAGTEASGTGNMKFGLNGALTIGTLDGANIEMMEEVGRENIFIFGMTAEEVAALRARGYNSLDIYHSNAELKQTLDMINSSYFSPDLPGRFRPIFDALTTYNDHYLLLADYVSYMAAQDRVDALYRDQEEWSRRAILNVANMGKFSSDRTVSEYAEQIWNVKPVTRK